MKRRLLFRFLFLALTIGLVLSFKPLLISAGERQLKKILKADSATIQNLEFHDFHEVILRDIQVGKKNSYDLKAQAVSLIWRPFALSSQNPLKLTFTTVSLDMQMPKTFASPQQPIPAFPERFSRVPRPEVEIIDLSIKVSGKGLKLSGRVSCDVDLATQKVNSLYFNIPEFEVDKVRVENLTLWATRGNERGDFSIGKVTYEKATLTEVKSLARFDERHLDFDEITAHAFEGNITGNAFIDLDIVPSYESRLQFQNLDISRFVRDFELQNKFTMTGAMGGQLKIEGHGADVAVVAGDFMMSKSGGLLTIIDKSFLENIAKRTAIDYDIVVQSLQEYHYNIGKVNLSLKDDALTAEIDLDGEKGPKHFIVANHLKDGL